MQMGSLLFSDSKLLGRLSHPVEFHSHRIFLYTKLLYERYIDISPKYLCSEGNNISIWQKSIFRLLLCKIHKSPFLIKSSLIHFNRGILEAYKILIDWEVLNNHHKVLLQSFLSIKVPINFNFIYHTCVCEAEEPTAKCSKELHHILQS